MDSKPTTRAVCADCGAAFRVPSASRTYTCKKCGGKVRAQATLELERTCAVCRAVLPAGNRYCPECGSDSAAETAPVEVPGDKEARRQAVRDLARAGRSVRFVRGVFWVLAVVFGLGAIVKVFELADLTVPIGATLVQLALFSALTALAVVGTQQVALHPFGWSLGIACLWTVSMLIVVLGRQFPGVLDIAIAVGLWLALVPALRAGRLVRAYPDSYSARAILGVHVPRIATGAELHAMVAREIWRRSAVRGGVVLVTSVLVAATVWWTLRPQALEPRLGELAAAWNRSDAVAVAELFAPERRDEQRKRLGALATTRGWTTWPALDFVVGTLDEPEGFTHEHLFPLDGGPAELFSEWKRIERNWILQRLLLPPPPLDEALRAFTNAWHAGDAALVASCFARASRDRMGDYLVRLEERRGWTAGYPSLVSHEVVLLDHDDADVWFETEGERFRTRWRVDEEDRWVLVSLDPPDR